MNWHDALNGEGFKTWLVEIAGGNRILQGQTLDPFTTSMRVLKQTTSWLSQIIEDGTITGTDSQRRIDQAIIDLGSAGLVSRGDSLSVSNLGLATLESWRELNINNDSDDDELARCLILLENALLQKEEGYLEIYNFWGEIRSRFDVLELIRNPEKLYLVSYLNQSHDGYNPWRIVHVSTQIEDIQTEFDWDALREGMQEDNSVSQSLDNLQRRVADYATRSIGRQNFCLAMELYSLATEEALSLLEDMELSPRTVSTCSSIVQNLSKDGLLDYTDLSSEDPILQTVNRFIDHDRKNIIFVGPPGTSKTWYALQIGSVLCEFQSSRFRNIQFHQSFGYEDFMEGYIPSEGSSSGFSLVPKTFLETCAAASADPDNLYVLVIDELNRGDPSRIFGEALTYIERRGEEFTLSSGTRAHIPTNLILLTTINPIDKSIAEIDMALDRRFEKIQMSPDPDLLRKILSENEFPLELIGPVLGFFNQLQQLFENRIGHAYFSKVKDIDSLEDTWNYAIRPLIENEYQFRQNELTEINENFEGLIETLNNN